MDKLQVTNRRQNIMDIDKLQVARQGAEYNGN
jgi:hypothetical protein